MSYFGFNFGLTIAFIVGCVLYAQYECNKAGKTLRQDLVSSLPEPLHLQHVFVGIFFFCLFWILMLIAGWIFVGMALFAASEKVVLYKGKSK